MVYWTFDRENRFYSADNQVLRKSDVFRFHNCMSKYGWNFYTICVLISSFSGDETLWEHCAEVQTGWSASWYVLETRVGLAPWILTHGTTYKIVTDSKNTITEGPQEGICHIDCILVVEGTYCVQLCECHVMFVTDVGCKMWGSEFWRRKWRNIG